MWMEAIHGGARIREFSVAWRDSRGRRATRFARADEWHQRHPDGHGHFVWCALGYALLWQLWGTTRHRCGILRPMWSAHATHDSGAIRGSNPPDTSRLQQISRGNRLRLAHRGSERAHRGHTGCSGRGIPARRVALSGGPSVFASGLSVAARWGRHENRRFALDAHCVRHRVPGRQHRERISRGNSRIDFTAAVILALTST